MNFLESRTTKPPTSHSCVSERFSNGFVLNIHQAQNAVVKQRSMFALKPQVWGGRIALCMFTAFLAHPFINLEQYSASSFCYDLLAIQHKCRKSRPDAEGGLRCDCAVTAAYTLNKVKLFLCTPWRHMGGVEALLHAFLTSTLDRYVWSASQSDSFPPRESRWIGGWVDATAVRTFCRSKTSRDPVGNRITFLRHFLLLTN
jgi:hypothetical protein